MVWGRIWQIEEFGTVDLRSINVLQFCFLGILSLFTSTRNSDTHYFSIWINSTCRPESVTGHAIEKVESVFFTQRKNS